MSCTSITDVGRRGVDFVDLLADLRWEIEKCGGMALDSAALKDTKQTHGEQRQSASHFSKAAEGVIESDS